MATQLGLYNAALRELGERKLASLSERGESRRNLDDVYSDVLEDCLLTGSWNFATETVKLVADTGIEPNFGFNEVFAKPTDWLRTHSISQDEYLSIPLLQYYDDSTFWAADVSPIYVRYVSNDTGLGLDLGNWPRSFTRYVELELATRVCERLTQDAGKLERLEMRRDKARRRALNHDAMNEPNPKFPPVGTWNRARGGGNRSDRGSRQQLTG
jgi:hypothetical protein